MGITTGQGGGTGTDVVARSTADAAAAKLAEFAKNAGETVDSGNIVIAYGEIWESTADGSIVGADAAEMVANGFVEGDLIEEPDNPENLIGVAPFTGAAPAGAKVATDITTGAEYYVDGGNQWQPVPIITAPSEVIHAVVDLTGAAPTGAKTGQNTLTGAKFFVDSSGNWQPEIVPPASGEKFSIFSTSNVTMAATDRGAIGLTDGGAVTVTIPEGLPIGTVRYVGRKGSNPVIGTVGDGTTEAINASPDGQVSLGGNGYIEAVKHTLTAWLMFEHPDTTTDTSTGTIVAGDDDLSSPTVAPGGTTATIFTNDTLNGIAVTPADITAAITNNGGITGLTIDAQGRLIVPVAASDGTYNIEYSITENADNTNTDTGAITLVVLSLGVTFPEFATRLDILETNIATIPMAFHEAYYEQTRHEVLAMINPMVVNMVANIPWTHQAVQAGLWSDTATWGGAIPGENANVLSDGFDIEYDVDSDVKIQTILFINGAKRTTARTKTKLVCDTEFYGSGYECGTPEQPIPDSGIVGVDGKRVHQHETIYHVVQAPGTTMRGGLVTWGEAPVRKCGAQYTHRVAVAGDILATATSFVLEEIPVGWEVGHDIAIMGTGWTPPTDTDAQYTAPTTYWGLRNGQAAQLVNRASSVSGIGFAQSQTEIRTITGINKTTGEVTVDTMLVYDHVRTQDLLPSGDTVDVKPHICFMSSSVDFRSSRASDALYPGDLSDLQKRAHHMHMHSEDVQALYCKYTDLGRTASDVTLDTDQNTTENDIILDVENGVSIANPLNVVGRYPLHFHGNGPFLDRCQVTCIGNIITTSTTAAPPIPGWGLVHHNCRAAVERNNVYNCRGAGIVSEQGNELGHWVENSVMRVRGDGFDNTWGSRQERVLNHHGHSGVAYENQARQIIQCGNYAEGCHYGFNFHQQNIEANQALYGDYVRWKRGRTVPDHASIRLRSPIAETHPGSAQIAMYTDNVCFGVHRPFSVRHRRLMNRNDMTPMIAQRNHAINCPHYFWVPEYSWNYGFYDFLHLGTGITEGWTFETGTVQWGWNFGNFKVKDCARVWPTGGMPFNFNGTVYDYIGENVGTYGNYGKYDFTTDPSAHSLYNCMANWTTISGGAFGGAGPWEMQVDDATPMDSATNFPMDTVGGKNRPSGPFGIDAEHPSMVGRARPYVFIDTAASTFTVGTETGQVCKIVGYIADGVGLRPLWSYQIMHSIVAASDYGMRNIWETENVFLDSNEIVSVNGYYDDGGTLKTRIHPVFQDRLNKVHFTGPIYNETGTVTHIDLEPFGLTAETLALYQLAGPAPVPTLPVLPEKIELGAVSKPPTTPIIKLPEVSGLVGGVVFNQILRVDKIYGTWSLTGADAAIFEIATMPIGSITNAGNQTVDVLRYAGNAARPFGGADPNIPEIFDITLTFTTPGGLSANVDHIVTVFDPASVATSVDINWAGAGGENIEDLAFGAELIAGAAGSITIDATPTRIADAAPGTPAYYGFPNISRVDDFEIFGQQFRDTETRIEYRNPVTDPITGISIYRNRASGLLTLEEYFEGTLENTWTFTLSATQRALFQFFDGGFEFTFHNDSGTTPSIEGTPQTLSRIPLGARGYLKTGTAAGPTLSRTRFAQI